jgi:sirohydrochlorin ferrochelatase
MPERAQGGQGGERGDGQPPLCGGSPGGRPPGEKGEKTQQVLIAVAHGSRDPRAAATMGDLMAIAAGHAEKRARKRGLSPPGLRVAYLGHAAPSLPQVLSTIEPDADVTVLPLLLTAAYHSKTDIPRVLASSADPRLRVSYGATLGPHPLLFRALERRLVEADPTALEAPERTGVVLAAAGSSDPEANATIARLAAQWRARTGWFAVRPAYASAADPTPAAAVAGLLRAGASQVVVASYLLAPGLFADRIVQAGVTATAAAVSPVLGASPEVAEVLLDRYEEAGTRQRTAA